MPRDSIIPGPAYSAKWLLPFGVVVLSLTLRVWNITSLPIFIDESNNLRWAYDMLEQRTRMSLLIPIHEDGKQPLFIWLVALAMRFFADPLVAGRIVSALAGSAATLGILLLGRWLDTWRTGLVAAFLYALAPYPVFFDRIGLMDGTIAAASVWASCLGVRIAMGPSTQVRAILLGAALGTMMGIAVWVKMTGLFVLPIPLLCLLLVRKRRDLARACLALAVGYGLFALLAGIMVLLPEAENLIEKGSHFSLTPAEILTFPLALWGKNAAAYISWLQTYLPSPLSWLVLAAVVWGLGTRRRETLLLLGCWISLAVPPILVGKDLFTSRYLVPSIPPLVVMVGLLMVKTWERGARAVHERLSLPHVHSISRGIGLLLLLATVAPSAAFDIQLLTDPSRADLVEFDRFQYISGFPSGYGFREAIELIKSRAAEQGGEVIVLTDDFRMLPRDGALVYL
ncbi:MAG TPA: glycosyltransferase family 39 protein, partial [Chloroflexota bacterium]|nr:glycosyltransferase family 39 protein [Chloroflexota bacterium]